MSLTTFLKQQLKHPLLLGVVFWAVFSIKVFPQNVELPMHKSLLHKQEQHWLQSKTITAQSIKPLLLNVSDTLGTQTLWVGKQSNNTWADALFNRKPIKVEKSDFRMLISPMLNVAYSDSVSGFKQMYVNTRGIRIEGTIGKKVSYITDFYENQAYLLGAENEFALHYMVVPGQGASKTFKGNGHDFSAASGRIHLNPTNWLNISVGNGKHFIGQGYRSLLLSDNAFNYPFLRTDIHKGKLRYTAMLMRYEEFYHKYYSQHIRKHATVLHLSYLPSPKLEISLFEGIIWQTSDTLQTNKMPAAMLLPIPGVRMLASSLSGEMNPNLGLDFRYSPHRFLQLYGQVLIDDLKSTNKKYGLQAGTKFYDAFMGYIPKSKLFLQAEYNLLSPNTGLNESKFLNYTHYNQPLAHPAGTGLSEKLLIAELNIWRVYFRASYSVITATPDMPILAATNMYFRYLPEQAQELALGLTTYKSAEIGFIINPAYNLSLALGTRKREHPISGGFNFTYISIKTALRNFYTNF